MTTIQYMPKNEWPYRETAPIEPLPSPDELAYIFVHHTAGRHSADPKIAFARLNELCISEGHRAIYYNFLVHYNTLTSTLTIAEGRGDRKSGATKGQNNRSITICVLGYFHPGALQTPLYNEHVAGVSHGIAWMVNRGLVHTPDNDRVKILGHRDNPLYPNATACPGDSLYARLNDIRNGVTALLAPPARPEVKLGDNNCVVAELQSRLRRYVPNIAVDGKFGPQTDGIVRQWQSFFGHSVTGVVGEDFWNLLDVLDAG